jgi:DnaJ like chaperone protein
MGLTGTLFGGTLGWVLFGPLGGLIGSFIGSKFGEGASSARKASTQGDFAVALIALCAHVIKADGRVASAEVRHVRDFVVRTFPASANELMQLLQRLTEQAIPVHEISQQIAQNLNYYERVELLQLLAAIAHADGHLHIAEDRAIREIAASMQVSTQDVAHVLGASGQRTGGSSGGSSSKLTDAYTTLGMEATSSDAELKDAYRKLAKNFHPDRVAHLGEDFRKFAEEKFKELQGAWSEIRASRNL